MSRGFLLSFSFESNEHISSGWQLRLHYNAMKIGRSQANEFSCKEVMWLEDVKGYTGSLADSTVAETLIRVNQAHPKINPLKRPPTAKQNARVNTNSKRSCSSSAVDYDIYYLLRGSGDVDCGDNQRSLSKPGKATAEARQPGVRRKDEGPEDS